MKEMSSAKLVDECKLSDISMRATKHKKDGWYRLEAIKDSKVVGVIETSCEKFTYQDGVYWPIYLVYVDENARHKGIAESLYRELLNTVDGDGLVSLPAFRGNSSIPEYLNRRFNSSTIENKSILIRRQDNLSQSSCVDGRKKINKSQPVGNDAGFEL